ncbi:hypothetical protein [Actinomadura alba]|uniref:Uncharacterized protein n=1 Tax=Actinomadura alba TaxID=406431 RepID=A0ABR7M0N1_9ACTN|nr:hypothetical protein [Actinomadura alba]MBC6470674.1 hypothetical protein [Actinomadura alba]
MFVGLSAGAIIALTTGVSAALVADPSASPSTGTEVTKEPATDPSTSPTPEPPPPAPVLYVDLVLPSGSVHAGDSVKARVHVWATRNVAQNTKLRLDTNANATVSSQQTLGKVGEAGVYRTMTVTIRKGFTKGSVPVTAIATATGAKTKTDGATITVTKKPTPSSTSSSNSSGSGSSSSGSTGSTGTSTGTTGTTPYVPPSPTGGLESPQVSLPEIPASAPSMAPTLPAAAPSHTLRSGGSPQAQELTFERLASTQAAWLAALLVAFSVLLTQVRLGRPAADRRPKGDHRRPRHGLFQR